MNATLKNGDVVLVVFPFTDLSGTKLRPAAVVSSDLVHSRTGDYTLIFISSVVPEKPDPFEKVFRAGHGDFKTSGLKKDSVFKTHKIVTVSKNLIRRKLGTLGKKIREELRDAFAEAVKI